VSHRHRQSARAIAGVSMASRSS